MPLYAGTLKRCNPYCRVVVYTSCNYTFWKTRCVYVCGSICVSSSISVELSAISLSPYLMRKVGNTSRDVLLVNSSIPIHISLALACFVALIGAFISTQKNSSDSSRHILCRVSLSIRNLGLTTALKFIHLFKSECFVHILTFYVWVMLWHCLPLRQTHLM